MAGPIGRLRFGGGWPSWGRRKCCNNGGSTRKAAGCWLRARLVGGGRNGSGAWREEPEFQTNVLVGVGGGATGGAREKGRERWSLSIDPSMALGSLVATWGSAGSPDLEAGSRRDMFRCPNSGITAKKGQVGDWQSGDVPLDRSRERRIASPDFFSCLPSGQHASSMLKYSITTGRQRYFASFFTFCYMSRFGHLSCFASDVESFYSTLAQNERAELLERFIGISESLSSTPLKKLGQSITIFKLEELFGFMAMLPVEVSVGVCEDVTVSVKSLVELEGTVIKMADMYCKNLVLSSDLDPQDNIYGEELLQIASSTLVMVRNPGI
ncbi:hypothetical protein KSP40_PGU022393 [Platanthera guangdongensis]|uniref:Uncharacterized protein n=1 Tax=Platanthera guangdongensis TaxID=2320717 RepID=A0ABR2N4J9_9ASPA